MVGFVMSWLNLDPDQTSQNVPSGRVYIQGAHQNTELTLNATDTSKVTNKLVQFAWVEETIVCTWFDKNDGCLQVIVQLTTEEQLQLLFQENQACHQWMNTTLSNLTGIIDKGRGIWYHLVGLGRVPGNPGSCRLVQLPGYKFTTRYPNVNYRMYEYK